MSVMVTLVRNELCNLVCISHSANTLVKYMNLITCPPAMGKW